MGQMTDTKSPAGCVKGLDSTPKPSRDVVRRCKGYSGCNGEDIFREHELSAAVSQGRDNRCLN